MLIAGSWRDLRMGMKKGSTRNTGITEVKRRAKSTEGIVPDLKVMIQVMIAKQKGKEKRNPSTKREDTALHQTVIQVMTERELTTVKNHPFIHTITTSIAKKFIYVHGICNELLCIVGLGFGY